MEKSLKDANRLPLLSIMAGNLLVYYCMVQGIEMSTQTWVRMLSDLGAIMPGGVAIALTGIINSQLSADTKARIVFLEWSHPLPGCAAFSKYAPGDSRISMAAVEAAHGPLPTEPREQNVLWYRLYRSVISSPSIQHLNRNWLFSRDYACLMVLLIVTLGAAGLAQITSPKAYIVYLLVLFAQMALAMRAARHNAVRLVTTVVAEATAR